MSEKLQTLKYVFTVEGETEKWYLEWLRDRINEYPDRKCNVAVDEIPNLLSKLYSI